MKASAVLISMLTGFVLIVGSANASSKPKAEKIVRGTVVVTNNSDLVIRKGKNDMTLMYDSASQKPEALAPGTSVLVHYRDEKHMHVAVKVEVASENTGVAQ